VIETSGPRGEVLKFLTSLTITDAELKRGLAILGECIAQFDEELATSVAGGG
jgi:diaminobutyrate-2-oxoglutarate transaminase